MDQQAASLSGPESPSGREKPRLAALLSLQRLKPGTSEDSVAAGVDDGGGLCVSPEHDAARPVDNTLPPTRGVCAGAAPCHPR